MFNNWFVIGGALALGFGLAASLVAIDVAKRQAVRVVDGTKRKIRRRKHRH
jgi:hypothetical protein